MFYGGVKACVATLLSHFPCTRAGTDLRTASAATLQLYTHPGLLLVQGDALGQPGYRVDKMVLSNDNSHRVQGQSTSEHATEGRISEVP